MNYLLAIVCPPWAMSKSRKPFQATLAALGLILAAVTWSSGVGVLLAAAVMIWACRVASDAYAAEEVEGFLKLFPDAKAR